MRHYTKLPPTLLETELYNLLLEIQDYMTSGKPVSRKQFIELMRHVMRGIKLYENKVEGTRYKTE